MKDEILDWIEERAWEFANWVHHLHYKGGYRRG